jgi:hypothetical protein
MGQIVLHQVSKTYPGGVRGVDALNLEIGDGEFMVLVGPSGCGIDGAAVDRGLEEITALDLDRRAVVNGLPPKDRDIAMVFQNYALYPHMTVAQNLAFGLGRTRAGGEAAGRPGGPDARPGGAARPQARRAVRRSGSGGDGPGDRRAAGVPDGRAAVEPGRQAAGLDAGVAGAAARAAGGDHVSSRTTRSRR